MPAFWCVIRVKRLLDRAKRFCDVLKVNADSRPRREPSTHGIHENIGRLEMRSRFRMTPAPPLESRECVLFLGGAPDLDQRMLRRSFSRRLHARRFTGLLLVLRR